jgi:hypothetical protein
MIESQIWQNTKSRRYLAALIFAWIGIAIAGCLWDVFAILVSTKLVGNFPWATQLFQTTYRIVLWIALFYGIFYGVLALHLLAETRRLLSPFARTVQDKMERLTLISRHYMLVRVGRALLVFLGLFGMFSFVVFSDIRLLALVILSVGVLFWLRVRISMPPIVLLLASSNKRSIARHLSYKRFMSPLRAVSLLDTTGLMDDGRSSELELDCLRTNNDDDWWPVIRTLMDCAPFLIFDCTATTPGVIREREYAISAGLMYKTIFVRGLRSDCPLIDTYHQSSNEAKSELCSVDGTSALKLINSVLLNRRLPTSARPLSKLLQW